MSEPIDFVARRCARLQAHIARAQRQLVEAEADARDNRESIAELRRFARVMGPESDQGRDALTFADRMERDDAACLTAIRAAVIEELHTARAELEGLARSTAESR